MTENYESAKRDGDGTTVRLAEHFAQSDKFRALFADGMQLVEESANYLDGPGRSEAKDLPRTASVLYASESMRLTTRLMQLASWLLLQRAVGDGEMTRAQVLEEKRKVKLDQLASNIFGPGWDEVPHEFRELVRRSMVLQKRISLLDGEIYGEVAAEPIENPVNAQLDRLANAFRAAGK